MSKQTLPLDAFVRAVGIDSDAKYAVFLGAGASITSGIPTAELCIWEWKRDIFLTNNPGVERQFSELTLPSVKERIQQWLDAQVGHPVEGATNEYSFYIEHCYPVGEHRKLYFAEKTRAASPHIGYKMLCLLAEVGLITSVWTTNFDNLTARAAAEFNITPIEAGIDCQHRTIRQTRKGELICVSLHGDYRYDNLKNLDEELKQQETQLTETLSQKIGDSGLIVLGYSGRDKSIMDVLEKAFSQPGSSPLYWCGYGDEISDPVKNLLDVATSSGRTAYFVPTQGFDDILIRLALHCLPEAGKDRVKKYLSEAGQELRKQNKPFSIPQAPTTTLIKSNAFDMEWPSEVFAFDVKEWPEKTWNWLDQLSASHRFVAVPLRKKVLALGLLDEIREVFKDNVRGIIERTPVTEDDKNLAHGAVTALMLRALVKAFSEKSEIEGNNKYLLWEKRSYTRKNIKEAECFIHRAVELSIRKFSGRLHLVLKPTVEVLDSNGIRLPNDIVKIAKMEVLGYQHNKEFNQALELWRKHLLPGKGKIKIEYPGNCGSTFRFRVRAAPQFAKIGSKARRHSIKVDERYTHLIKHQGIEIPEPKLLFCTRQGTRNVTDTHPLRGLKENRPFDFSLTLKGLSPSVRLGVVCPEKEAEQLKKYLFKSNRTHYPNDSEKDYLIEYSGFQQAFGIPLEIPNPNDNSWVPIPEPQGEQSIKQCSLQLAGNIIRSIDSVVASENPHVVLVYIPKRWGIWRGYSDSQERFDLHDFVKSYCVQKGIATQFLEEDTLLSNQQCRIWWWLSLALYAKAMRTPWVLEALDPDLAFVGLGFTIDRFAAKGKRVVLGCSHLYNAQGEGLQFRLTKVENPYFMGRNPHMSYDDARRVAEKIRQLFCESHFRLPNRVVVHKQTPFLKAEKEGLMDGLGGVDIVDLLEINIDSAMRYVSSRVKSDGNFDEDNYPVRRGTIVKIDDREALVWCHGVTDAVIPSWRYFQGKRHIPSPLLLRRHSGSTSLETLTTEILGLSKMDWNSGDLYSKLPATIYSSKAIARIGSKLQRFGQVAYDYRLFM